MSDGVLLLILMVPMGFAFGFGIWAGLGYPGLHDKYDKTGRAPRESPLRWLLRGGRRPLTSELAAREGEEEKDGKEAIEPTRKVRPSFDRGRRFKR